MRVNDKTFVVKLENILEDYKNDKIDFPWAVKKTSEKGNQLTLELYLSTIANINSLPDHAAKYKDVNLDKWMVPACFAPLVMPAKVTIDNSDDAINLVDTKKEHTWNEDKKVDGKPTLAPDMDFESFMKINHTLRRIYRKDESTWFKPIGSLRTPKLLADVADIAAHEELTPYYKCMPLQLQIKFYDTESYVHNINKVAERFMREHIAKELGGVQPKQD